MADGSKTEKATPKKRRDERKKGNVFMSQDAVSVATLLGAFGVLMILSNTIVEQMSQFMQFCISAGANPDQFQTYLPKFSLEGGWALLVSVGPIMAVVVFCAVAATFGQTKFLVSGESIRPKFSRISPLQGVKRLFSLRSLIEALKGIVKIALLMIFIYLALESMFSESSKYFYTDIPAAVRHVYDVTVGMIWQIVGAFIAVAALDFFYQWRDYERQMRMTKQEVKEEYKQLEGNPQIKGKIRDIQRQMARSRMMQQVPQADVVIRNPTHVAVALRYKPEKDAAPVVMALGQDELALRIVKKAEECHIAVIENVPLARALYAKVQLNQQIPEEFYGAVAEVLVYIFRLNEKKQLVKETK